jgi:hypothetical protein
VSYHSRSLVAGRAGRVILKLTPDLAGRGVIQNEQLFMRGARDAGLAAPEVEIVRDLDGVEPLAIVRFARSSRAGQLVRHAQEDACQVPGLRPAQKCDPDPRTVISALSQLYAPPPVAARDLLHQMLYSYAVGNNDLHAKNLPIGQDPSTGIWSVTPVDDVPHTWPYESGHRFHPAVHDRPHDAVTRRHWLALAADIGLPRKVTERLYSQVAEAVGRLADGFEQELLDIPPAWIRDMHRRGTRRVLHLRPCPPAAASQATRHLRRGGCDSGPRTARQRRHHRRGGCQRAVKAGAPTSPGRYGVGRGGVEPLTPCVSSSTTGSSTVHPGPRNLA